MDVPVGSQYAHAFKLTLIGEIFTDVWSEQERNTRVDVQSIGW